MGSWEFASGSKNLFIYGAFVSIITIALIGTVIDAIRGSIDAYFDFLYATLAFIAFNLCKKSNSVEKAGIILFWISAIMEFIFIYLNGADFDLIFAILIPIIAFISMNLRQIIINLLLFYTILIAILIYYYINYPTHFILHNSKYLISYIYIHIFMVAYGFFYHLSISESIKRLESLNNQNTLLLKEIHHRVKNNLNIISSILGLQALKISDKEAQEALLGSRKRIESMATLHEVLYKNRAQDSVSLKSYTDKLVNSIITSESFNNKVKVNLNIEDTPMSISSLIQFGILLNELVTNSIKYAKPDNENIIIDITFKREKEHFFLQYCDNANSVDLDKLKKGFGYKLITLAISHFNGEFTLETKNGFCYNIILNELYSLKKQSIY